jgi:phospholipase/carboxylesterase
VQGGDGDEGDRAFMDALGALGPALLNVLGGFEQVTRRLDPSGIDALRTALAPCVEQLRGVLAQFEVLPVPDGLSGLREQLLLAAGHAAAAGRSFLGAGPGQDAVAGVLGAMHEHCRAQHAAFSLRSVFPSIDRYFMEPRFHDRLETAEAEPGAKARVGLFNAHNDPGSRGGFSLYVPESYDGSRDWPMVVALHGGHGHGADFIWTWLRESRGRDFLLLSPTSRGATWSFNGPDVDGPALASMLSHVTEEWRVDAERILLTGLSDGATYTLMCGMGEESPFTALAPVSGVLHPLNFANGNLERARGRRIYLVHGARDWMFPVDLARDAVETLRAAGADVAYREIEDLSHTYPREENARIIEWFLRESA